VFFQHRAVSRTQGSGVLVFLAALGTFLHLTDNPRPLSLQVELQLSVSHKK
jgi:hypothetical protein